MGGEGINELVSGGRCCVSGEERRVTNKALKEQEMRPDMGILGIRRACVATTSRAGSFPTWDEANALEAGAEGGRREDIRPGRRAPLKTPSSPSHPPQSQVHPAFDKGLTPSDLPG